MDVKSFHQAAKAKYWQEKNLAEARRLLEEGIELARQQGLKSEEKAMNYDLASFCWEGWDEPGIVVTPEDSAAGAQAADENLRLAQELGRPAFPLSNAWWMVGAYRMQQGDFTGACRSFEAFRALTGADAVRTLLADGYIELARMFGEQTGDLPSVCTALRALEGDGPAYAEQLETACRVYQGRWAIESDRGR